jgi:hypothetical protein
LVVVLVALQLLLVPLIRHLEVEFGLPGRWVLGVTLITPTPTLASSKYTGNG